MDTHTAREWRRYLSTAFPVPPRVERGRAPLNTERATDVTIVITLYNYERYIGPCLRSAIRSAVIAAEVGVSCEILVVDDKSTDLSRHIVRKFLQSESRVSIAMLCKNLNTGLAPSRNLGICHARGRYVMILDADNILMPPCIHTLYSLAEAGGLDAVYPVIQRFRDQTGELDGLLSQYPFELERLLRENYIDAMALFRVDTLSKLEGYDEEMSYGWEDYELWLKMAAMGCKVCCVDRVLAFYRIKDESMLSSTNINRPLISRYLRKKYASRFRRHLPPTGRRFGLTDEELNPGVQLPSVQELVAENDTLHSRIADLERRIADLENELAECSRALEDVLASRTWQATRPLREFIDKLRALRRSSEPCATDETHPPAGEHP